jgi:hypothetical protein
MEATTVTAIQPRARAGPTDNDLRQALAILNKADADERALDWALDTLMQVSSVAAPPLDFSRRVMTAVGRTPLAEGRVPLGRPRAVWPRLAAFGASAAVVAGIAVATFGPRSAPMLAGMLTFAFRLGLSTLTSTTLILQLANATVTAGATLADTFTSPAVAIGLAATMLVGMLSLAALTHLLSATQESPQ